MPRYYLRKINKWWTLASCLPVALGGGLAYAFSVWSPALKEAYGLDQSQLEAIGAWHNLGGYSSFISGLVYDALERRHHVGPRVTILVGCLNTWLGYLGLWAAITRRFNAQLWQLGALAVLAGNGGTWFDTSTLATNLRNFPAERGVVVGLVKASVGLSSALYSSFYLGFFQPRADQFVLFLAVVPCVVGILASPLVNYVPFVQKSELERGQALFSTEGRFLFALQALGTLAVYLMAIAIANGMTSLPPETRAVLALGALVLCVPLLMLPFGSGGLFAERVHVPHALIEEEDEEEEQGAEQRSSPREPLLMPAATHTAAPSGQPSKPAGSAAHHVPSVGVAESLGLLNFWLMAGICAVGMGCGLALLNNLAQIVAALGGPKEARSVLVALFGVASCGGRLLFGAIPEKALQYGTPRPVFFLIAGLMNAAALCWLAFSNLPLLYPLVTAAGLAFGAHWSLLPSMASELFGLESFASIYCLLQLAPAAGGYAIGARLVPWLYQAALRRHGDPGATCVGPDCFRSAFLLMAGMAAGAACLSAALLYRTRGLYSELSALLQSFLEDTHQQEAPPAEEAALEAAMPR